jgi:hypothetical protein
VKFECDDEDDVVVCEAALGQMRSDMSIGIKLAGFLP